MIKDGEILKLGRFYRLTFVTLLSIHILLELAPKLPSFLFRTITLASKELFHILYRNKGNRKIELFDREFSR